jgi:amino acid transporter
MRLLKIFLGIVTIILFLMSIIFCAWIAFSVGPMRCSLPNRCTTLQENLYAVLSILVMLIPFAFIVFSFKGISRL